METSSIRLLPVSTAWVIGITIVFLVGLILVRSLQSRTFFHYRPFYFYLLFVFLADFLRSILAVLLGTSSSMYYHAYTIPTYFMPVFQIWVLCDLYRRIIGHTKTPWKESARLAIIAGMLATPIAVGVVLIEGSGPFHEYHTVTLFAQMALCLLVSREAIKAREEIDLGQNLKGILTGMSLLVGGQAINFVGFTFAQSSSQVFWFSVQFIYFVALIVFTYTLWDYAPIARVDPSYRHRLEKLNRELYEVLKTVLLNRR